MSNGPLLSQMTSYPTARGYVVHPLAPRHLAKIIASRARLYGCIVPRGAWRDLVPTLERIGTDRLDAVVDIAKRKLAGVSTVSMEHPKLRRSQSVKWQRALCNGYCRDAVTSTLAEYLQDNQQPA
jgi:hypothetical protein